MQKNVGEIEDVKENFKIFNKIYQILNLKKISEKIFDEMCLEKLLVIITRELA